jgi:uncharacterized protein (DUF1778 family)
MTTHDAAPKDARLNMRLTVEALETIKQAAAIQQQDLTSFVLGAALDRARSVLAEERILRLSPHDITQLEAMLDREPQVIPQLAALLTRYGNPAGSTAQRTDRTHA